MAPIFTVEKHFHWCYYLSLYAFCRLCTVYATHISQMDAMRDYFPYLLVNKGFQGETLTLFGFV